MIISSLSYAAVSIAEVRFWKHPVMMNRRDPVWLKIQLNKILWIAGIWTFLGMAKELYEISVRNYWDCAPAASGSDVLVGIGIFSLTAMLGGFLGGGVVVFFIEGWFRTLSYRRAFLYTILIYTALFIAVSTIGASLTHITGLSPSDSGRGEIEYFFQSTNFFKNYVFWFFVVIATSAGLIINDKYGPGMLKQVLLGKYFKPHMVKRVFMFLDLRGSTQIAERLSEKEYFSFLKELFEDITQPILYTYGEIYQYVGDEVVVSWNMKRGRQSANCIRCFREVQNVLKRKGPEYLEKYGVMPEFKAGLHYGEVLAGEIGVIKRDITFTGDVLNTTSRIQNKCNELGVDLLLSKQLLDRLGLAPHQYHPRRMGEIALRGKREQMVLYTL